MAKVIYVDVDDTLVRWIGLKSIPMPGTINHVRRLHQEGAVLYCWSTGGATYARDVATKLGIVDCFQAFLPKPNTIIDDQKIEDWRGFEQTHPLNLP